MHNRLLSLVSSTSFQIVQSCDGNGLEAWRLLSRRFNPTTPASCVSLMTQIINFKVARTEEVLSAIVRWDALVMSLERDHGEQLSEKMRVAFLLKAVPTSLSERLVEQLDRLKSYKEETFYLACSLADRYLVNVAVQRQRAPCLIRLAIVCTLMSAKLE